MGLWAECHSDANRAWRGTDLTNEGLSWASLPGASDPSSLGLLEEVLGPQGRFLHGLCFVKSEHKNVPSLPLLFKTYFVVVRIKHT